MTTFVLKEEANCNATFVSKPFYKKVLYQPGIIIWTKMSNAVYQVSMTLAKIGSGEDFWFLP